MEPGYAVSVGSRFIAISIIQIWNILIRLEPRTFYVKIRGVGLKVMQIVELP